MIVWYDQPKNKFAEFFPRTEIEVNIKSLPSRAKSNNKTQKQEARRKKYGFSPRCVGFCAFSLH